ncbi:unnamed protein product [Brugia timori]|uniref:Uncharacterized protein n=1 Tax=Brugia timori TaxID=42155 RepID=A0A0R3R666_9BILA|nr:unnamed protein product [Brugia timori]
MSQLFANKLNDAKHYLATDSSTFVVWFRITACSEASYSAFHTRLRGFWISNYM